MPWQNGNAVRNNGTFTGNQVWQDDAAAGTKILASNHDNHDQDLADMIGETLHRGGQNAILADIDWGGYRINNLGDPVVALDAANKGYVDGLETAARAYTDAEVATLDGQLAAVAKSGAYADLTDAPSLSAVATSGDYNDLSNRPVGGGNESIMYAEVSGTSIPINNSQSVVNATLTNTNVLVGSGSFTSTQFVVQDTGTYRLSIELEMFAEFPTVPVRFQVLPYLTSPNSSLGSRTFRSSERGRSTHSTFFVFDLSPGDAVYLQFRYNNDLDTSSVNLDYEGSVLLEKLD
jgi:hypothetical protein